MAASSTSCLNPDAEPYTSEASATTTLLYSASPATCFVPPRCLYAAPPTPPACVAAVACGCCSCAGGFPSKGCCACAQLVAMGVPVSFSSPPWVHISVHPPPPPPPCSMTMFCCRPPSPPKRASRCLITEIIEDGGDECPKVEEGDDEPSPRSVLAPWRRPKPTSPLPPKRRAALPPPPGKPAFDPSSNKTSLMICNIPNNFLKRRFMAMLDQHCAEENNELQWLGGGAVVKSEYDFLYVPIDFGTRCNKGYAFVNMTTATAARRLHAFLHGHRWKVPGSRKVCEVVHARIEGVDAFVAHFAGSLFPCRDKDFLPVRFGPPRNGLRQTAERVIGRMLPPHPC